MNGSPRTPSHPLRCGANRRRYRSFAPNLLRFSYAVVGVPSGFLTNEGAGESALRRWAPGWHAPFETFR